LLISAPQETAFLKQMTEELTALGAKVVVSEAAGFMRVDLTTETENTVRHFIERASKNSALITLQVAVLNVNLDKKRNVGIDWGALQAVIGTGAGAMLKSNTTQNSGTTPTVTDPTNTTNTTDTTTDSTSGGSGMFPWNASPTELLKGGSIVLGGQGAGLMIAQKAFNLTGMVNFLSTYGNARTMQNASLKTVSGNEVTLESGMSIPYVADVGVSSVGGGNSSSLMGTTRTSTAKSGITLKMNPRYDHDANLVTLKLDLSVESVVAFNTLSAGNQIGSLTQPTTAKQGFNDILQLRPGETAIVGGVIYDSHSDSKSAPALGDGHPIASNNGAVTKNEMFIVIRPTVKIQGKVVQARE
jgi:type II secretory pathway component GspD/PulD (secretin)